tara:strand:- start:16496 stop:18298 length:1803 start_codon:yes stop_codon:yes gene_type:complete
MRKPIYISFVLVLLTACAQQENPQHNKERELGAIVSGLSSEDQAKLASENIAYEKISDIADTYWVKDIRAEELESIIDNENIIQNREAVFPEPGGKPKTGEDLLNKYENSLSNEDGEEEQARVVPPNCNETAQRPIAVLKTLSHPYSLRMKLEREDQPKLLASGLQSVDAKDAIKERSLVRDGNLNLKTPQAVDAAVKYKLRKSEEAATEEDANLKYYWLVDMGVTKPQLFAGPKLEMTFPIIGSYTLGLIVQDQFTQGCAYDVIEIKLTANPELVALNSRPKIRPEKIKDFVHLDKLNTLYLSANQNGKDTVVAVMDSGVNYNHPSLRPNILMNPNEIPGNGLDDDGNGLADDIVGYDFENEDGYAFDDGGHGSHVAGIAAGADIGIAKQAKILPLKTRSFRDFLMGMEYAIKRGADVINMSFGFPGAAAEPKLVALTKQYFQALNQNNVIVVMAAGNDTLNINVTDSIPQNMREPNQLVVAAITEDDVITSYSNFGDPAVDIATYGGSRKKAIQSASLYDEFGVYFIGMSGTSMASPVVAGAVALVRQVYPNMQPKDVIAMIKKSSSYNANLKGKVSNARQLNLENLLSTMAPSPLML